MTYVDRTLTCVDCGVEFIHSAADQEYYTAKGFISVSYTHLTLPTILRV